MDNLKIWNCKDIACALAVSERANTMFGVHRFVNTASRAVVVKRNGARFVSLLKMKETVQRLLGMGSNGLPYAHVCQVGDPILRGCAMKIEPEVVKRADFQEVSLQTCQ